MMPCLAAAQHNNCIRSFDMYFQKMQRLYVSHSEMCQHFQEVFHIIKKESSYFRFNHRTIIDGKYNDNRWNDTRKRT